jgi:endonuclease/exonuclease/phosphatase (EEP) superfamily protein YafD
MKRFQHMHRILFRLLFLGATMLAVMVTALSLLGSLNDRWWMSELLSQPRPQYALVLMLCLPILVVRFQRAGWLTLIPLFLNMAAFTPLYFGVQPPAAPATGSYSLLHYVLDNTLSDHTAAFAYIRNHPVDILSLQELTPTLHERLPTELPGYHVAYSKPMSNAHGSALLLADKVGISVVSAGIVYLPKYLVRPIIAATFEIEGHEVAFLSLHVVRPVDPERFEIQQSEFAATAAWSQAQQALKRAVLIVGDFNATSWSSNFLRICREGTLVNSEQGHGVQPTWPASLPPLFGLPIDHCLHSQDIVITDRHSGPFLGSPHAPLHIQFSIAAAHGGQKAARSARQSGEDNKRMAEPSEVMAYATALDKLIHSQDTTVSVEAVYAKGRSAATKIMDVIEDLNGSTYHALAQKMKGFELNRIEILYVQPDVDFWLELSKRKGKERDIQFFETYKQTVPGGLWKAYLEPQTDYSGCIKFGSNDLVGLFGKWMGYKSAFPRAYVSSVDEFLKDIEYQLAEGIHSCYGQDKVLQELTAFLKTFPDAGISPRIRQRIQEIENNESNMKFNCLGDAKPQ